MAFPEVRLQKLGLGSLLKTAEGDGKSGRKCD